MNGAPSILRKIFYDKRRRLDAQKARLSGSEISDMRTAALEKAAAAEPFRLTRALSGKIGVNLIAEFKRASPSKGVFDAVTPVGQKAAEYEKAGAAAVSVLTEQDHFQGAPEDLSEARSAVSLPLLRKDFIFDAFQVYETRLLGADAVLLIAAMLGDGDLRELSSAAREVGLDVLLEVHDEQELARASTAGASLIGVNNRDLNSFEVSLDVSRRLIRSRPPNALMVAESGISARAEIEELTELGFNGFLVGEAAMKDGLTSLIDKEGAAAEGAAAEI